VYKDIEGVADILALDRNRSHVQKENNVSTEMKPYFYTLKQDMSSSSLFTVLYMKDNDVINS